MIIFRYMTLFLVYVQADLIGWNRTSNTVAKNNFRRAAASNLLDQYQQFFLRNNKNIRFMRSRRFLRSVQKF